MEEGSTLDLFNNNNNNNNNLLKLGCYPVVELSVILFPLHINPKTNFAYSKSCIPFTHESTRTKGIRYIKTENIIFALFIAGQERRGLAQIKTGFFEVSALRSSKFV